MKTSYKYWALPSLLALLPHVLPAQVFLDVNQVKTFVKPNNSLFWDGMSQANYEVPKGSGKHSMFRGALWLIGKSTGTIDLYGFADRYREHGAETFPGPLKADGSMPSAQTALEFGRVWKITQSDIDVLRQAQASGALQSGAYVPSNDIRTWPANPPAGHVQESLAPFVDADNNGIYDILAGDYPYIKGEQMLYWILNDNSGIHPETRILPMGVEIHVSLYACKKEGAPAEEDFINYTTFLEYEIINRSTRRYEEVYAGFDTDCDIGYPYDDMTGSHVDQDAFFFYNGDDMDTQGTNPGPGQYGADSPVQSIRFLEGAEANGHRMAGFMSFGQGGEPSVPQGIIPGARYYNYLRSRFWDDNFLHYGGDGYPGNPDVSTLTAKYMFPGDSDPLHTGTGGTDPGFVWRQENPANQRGVGSTGPFILPPGGRIKVVLGLITTFDAGISRAQRVEKNREQNRTLKSLYDAGTLPCVMSEAHLGNPEVSAAPEVTLYPNPAEGTVWLSGAGLHAGMSYTLTDSHGRILGSDQIRQEGGVNIQTETLSSGIYFIRLAESAGKSRVLKFIKK